MDENEIHQLIEDAVADLRNEFDREIQQLEHRIGDLESQLDGIGVEN